MAEYLKLANNADKQQASRQAGVRRRTRSRGAQTIAQLHKKLEHCRRRLRKIEQNGPSAATKGSLCGTSSRASRTWAPSVPPYPAASARGGGVKGGLSGLSQATHSAVVSKPREFASLIRNKFGKRRQHRAPEGPLDERAPERGGRALAARHARVQPQNSQRRPSAPAPAPARRARAATRGPGFPPPPRPGAQVRPAVRGPANVDWCWKNCGRSRRASRTWRDSMEDLKAQLQRLHLHDPVPAGGALQVRHGRPPGERTDFRFSGGSRRSISQRSGLLEEARRRPPSQLPGRLEDRMTGPGRSVMASLLEYMVVVQKGKPRQGPASYLERLWLRALTPGAGHLGLDPSSTFPTLYRGQSPCSLHLVSSSVKRGNVNPGSQGLWTRPAQLSRRSPWEGIRRRSRRGAGLGSAGAPTSSLCWLCSALRLAHGVGHLFLGILREFVFR